MSSPLARTLLALAILSALARPARAESTSTEATDTEGCAGEAPRLFVDAMSSTRVYPNADSALMGFRLGSLGRPFDKCIHFAGEGFARFGSKEQGPSEQDLKMRTAGAAMGALWGAGSAAHWFGAGAMLDMGWARVGPRDDFLLSAYLRALMLWKLRKQYSVGFDLRAGYVILPVTVGGVGISGPEVGIGIGAAWGKPPEGS